jgi:hypothetical protein
MSIISNHHPEVIDTVNADAQEGERPAPWDRPVSDSEINTMARHFNVVGAEEDDEELVILTGPSTLSRPAEKPDTVTVRRSALEAYQAANDRLWGFLDGLQRELERTQTCGPCAVERLSQSLRRKLEELDAAAQAWSRNKHAV